MFHLLSNLTTKYDEQDSEQDVLQRGKRSPRLALPTIWLEERFDWWNLSETALGSNSNKSR